MKFCVNCGNQVQDDDLFCDRCGSRLPDLKPEPEAGNQPQTVSEPEVKTVSEIKTDQHISSIKENHSEPAFQPASSGSNIGNGNTVICSNCGANVPAGTSVCPECGTTLQINSPAGPVKPEPVMNSNPQVTRTETHPVNNPAAQTAASLQGGIDALSQTGKAVAGKLQNTINNVATQAQRAVEQQRAQAQTQAAQNEPKFNRRNWNQFLKTYANEDEIWSWIQEGENKQVFFTQEPSEITEDEYLEKLKEKLKENGVPAQVERKQILWDQNEDYKTETIIRPMTEKLNAVTCVLQMRHVGKFTFVEERMFGKPPKLPKVGEKIQNFDLNRLILVYFGILLVGFVSGIGGDGSTFPIVFFLATAVCGFGFYKWYSINKHNKEVDEQVKQWNFAYSCWKQILMDEEYESMSYGDTGRIYTAVWQTVTQLNDELFKDARVSSSSSELDVHALESLINSRKEDYK